MATPSGTKFAAYDTDGNVHDLWFTVREGLLHPVAEIRDRDGKRVKRIEKGRYRWGRRMLTSKDPKAP